MTNCSFNFNGSLFNFKTEDTTTSILLYPTSADSDISGYKKLVNSNGDADYDFTAVDINTGAITGADMLLAELSTDDGIFIGDLGTITATTVGNIRRVSGTGEATFYFKMYHRDNTGAETLIGTSSHTAPVSDSIYEEFTASTLVDNGNFDITDRIVIKYYGTRIAGGSDPVYEFQFGGETPVRTLMIVPTANVVLDDKTDDITLDFTGGVLTYSYYSPYKLKFTSITNILNAPTTTILINSNAYTLGDTINIGDEINVTVDTSSVVRLNYYKL